MANRGHDITKRYEDCWCCEEDNRNGMLCHYIREHIPTGQTETLHVRRISELEFHKSIVEWNRSAKLYEPRLWRYEAL